LKDGIYWGLGHTSTILLIGILVLLFRINISTQYFHYLEAIVGMMLVTLGIYRLKKLLPAKKIIIHTHQHEHGGTNPHQHLHVHIGSTSKHSHEHSLAYGVGLVHGLAGSGALIVMVMIQIKEPINGLLYLLIFGIGSIGGMLIAAGLFSIPFSKKIMKASSLQRCLIIISASLCLIYGSLVIYDNVFR
ncbi:MAG: sulfite exporter TauE/SafE family protein, partial [Bacteroidota bacterium]|nr:sulfite exporter TauE/SafE family protein [Bacteroidota bacterium]